jgi:hypothetical protein
VIPAWLLAALLAVLPDAGRAERERLVDPVGIRNCHVYGRPAIADERLFFKLSSDGSTAVLRLRQGGSARWRPISDWHRRRKKIAFDDAIRGRAFEADLEKPTLGGAWRGRTREGGWWCTRIRGAPVGRDATGVSAWVSELMPAVTAAPQYPSEAIREAKEGRAVSCFAVRSSGEIVDAVVVDVSDEVFRAPTLAALARSRYRGWDDDEVVRPDCRSFIFRLGNTGAEPSF